MKYQVRIKDGMSDKPVSRLFDTKEEAEEKLKEVRGEILKTWATPDPYCAYIFMNTLLQPINPLKNEGVYFVSATHVNFKNIRKV